MEGVGQESDFKESVGTFFMPESVRGGDSALSKAGASSARFYWESFNKVVTSNEEVLIPTGMSVFPKEIFRASERWCRERYKNLVYYNQLSEGGHFAALEKPEEFVKELRRAFDEM